MTETDSSKEQCKDEEGRVTARRRWALLAKTLQSTKKRQRIRTDVEKNRFKVFTIIALADISTDEVKWYRYSLTIEQNCVSLVIRHWLRNYKIRDLIGFNNTGNVRIWPSEELLGYICLKHGEFFHNKSVLEVGGGMSCLAGILIGHFTKCSSVRVTDGNEWSVENVRQIIKANQPSKCPLTCDLLVWNDHIRHSHVYDVILAADCLFFEDSRFDLLQLMFSLLNSSGNVLIMAPKRGDSLMKFTNEARRLGFFCNTHRKYDDEIWKQHLKFSERRDWYDENVDYPIFLVMGKRSNCEEILNLGSVWTR